MKQAVRGSSSGAVEQNAPAKINLFLHVTGKRDDGYHLLDSLICFAGPADRLRLALHDKPEPGLAISGQFAEPLAGDPDNLVLQAIRALADATDRTPDIAATLIKELPVAAGIGGGSADAGAALRAAADLWALSSDDRALLPRVAETLGADVPICLEARPARVSGIGEIIEPVDLPDLPLLLVNPLVPCPTGPVFAARSGPFSVAAPALPLFSSASDLADWLTLHTRNDLEGPAIGLVPEIRKVLDVLKNQPGCRLARMSGSGATCFGIFEYRAAAADAATALRQTCPGWWVGF